MLEYDMHKYYTPIIVLELIGYVVTRKRNSGAFLIEALEHLDKQPVTFDAVVSNPPFTPKVNGNG